ncbi:MAG: hypothetical protein U0Q15_20170 [Kineosporiaceae bacterium]
MTADPFGAAAIRERVLAGWSAAAVRLREDANAEEELVLGGYRDRIVVELAQNAADAAARAGTGGRLLLRLADLDGRPVLVAANTGAPLDADGVQALCTLRASSKRGPEAQAQVGRFGVGFAAVLTVTDEPAVLSRGGGVRFSAADSRALVHQLAASRPDGDLDAELARRDGHVPALRLPFPAEGIPPEGYDTAVVLPLRDAAAHDVVLRRLAEVDDTLLLALPGLVEVVVEVPGAPARRLADVEERWRVLRGSGALDPALLADRPVEERARPTWQVTWAVPREGAAPDRLEAAVADLFGAPAGTPTASGAAPGVLHAPTPPDAPLPWPALLLGTFPLESTRRHVVPGPLTQELVGHAARLYADLLTELAEAGEDVLGLVPAGLAAGALDGALREAVLPLLAHAPLLPSAADPSVLLRPARAAVLSLPAGREADVVAALSAGTPGLVVRRGSPAAEAARRALDVREVSLADAVEAMPLRLAADAGRPWAAGEPGDAEEHEDAEALAWHAVYQALDALSPDPLLREALAGLPVPLADGRVVAGPRGTVVALGRPGDDLASAIAALGVRAVHPRAAHRLLERLGATVATPRALLELPAVRAAVAALAAGEDPLRGHADLDADPDFADQADAVLALVAGAVGDGELGPGDLPWLGELPLVDADGEPAPACALVLPASPAERLLEEAEFAPVADDLLQRWGADALVAAGVRAHLVLVRAATVALDAPRDPDDVVPGDPEDLDGWEQWSAEALAACARAGVDPADAVLEELLAVADLDAVRAAAWPQVLAWIAGDRAAREALTAPARVVHPRGVVDVLAYTAWWLRRELVGGPVADPEAHPVVRQVLPPAPGEVVDLDAGMRRALGCVRRLDELGTAGLSAVLDRLADPSLDLAPAQLVQAWQHVAALAEQLASVVGEHGGQHGGQHGAAQVPPAPSHVRVVTGEVTAVVSAEKVTVVDNPCHLQLFAPGEVITAAPEHAAALADLLDLPLAADEVRGAMSEVADAAGQLVPVPAAAAALLGLADAGRWCEHDRLVVDGAEVDWWVDDAGVVHAATLHGLALGLAASRGRWAARHALAEVLEDPSSLARLLTEGVFG